ncbi:hypothetical protein STCU_03085 [Strigomonas culicis]|uniref:Protein transport protein Sec61 subunit beta n=1 Tax=Strigomonas culicis TaxID=28005 RepID=S9USQ9_9TRYP|nr:hypothetical protein STCU_03085 [Strigomonas culicis]|eukprot:EPY31938.1 hypothetical protein STCU_03085 [Strigomonas culicis]
MKTVRRNPGAGPRGGVSDLEVVGIPVQPMQLLVSSAAFIISVILLHFFFKMVGSN